MAGGACVRLDGAAGLGAEKEEVGPDSWFTAAAGRGRA